MMYVYTIAGFALLFGGGEFLVRGAVAVSRRFGLSPLLIGMTVVAWCTSAPELVVSLGAALEGNSDIAIGNIVGSNIFNVLGVLGVSALIAPIAIKPAEARRDSWVMVFSAIGVALLTLLGTVGRAAGAVLLVALVLYLYGSYRAERRASGTPAAEMYRHEAAEFETVGSPWTGIAYIAAGLATLVIGSRLLITGATDLARIAGVSEAAIGLTLVAVGTSLPELATSVMAAVRRHSDVAIGNVVGSNIFNALGILGATALVRPVVVAERIAHVDVWTMVAVSVALLAILMWRGSIGRVAGGLFLFAYVAYVALLFGGAATG